MTTSFSADVDAWVRQTKERAEAVFHESAQEVVSEMQRPGPSVAATKAAIAKGLGSKGRGKNRQFVQGPVARPGEGGNMPVDTGYLRASLLASTSQMPTIREDARPADGQTYREDGQVALVIAGADLGETIYVGYTAAYARAVEYGHNGAPARAFVRLAAQNWQEIVTRVAAQAKARSA